jgi:hypothetical protein
VEDKVWKIRYGKNVKDNKNYYARKLVSLSKRSIIIPIRAGSQLRVGPRILSGRYLPPRLDLLIPKQDIEIFHN